MYIKPNPLLPPTSRIIRPYQCSFISTEGPNILGKLNLSGVEIPYDSQFTTRMVLNPGAMEQPLLYGFLGANVTFILLKVIYDELDPRCNVEEEQFIEYYFADQPFTIRYINKLLLLTGNSVHRIPQIYLNNTSEIKVTVEALVGNLEQADINIDDLNVITINNLRYNNLISNKVWTQSASLSGSTQLQVIGVDDYIQLYLLYTDILSIESDYTNFELIINTVSNTTIILKFLSLYEMYQAYSRLNWVRTFAPLRYLTIDSPSEDLVAPVFSGTTLPPPVLPSVQEGIDTYVFPINNFTTGSTILITGLDVCKFFVVSIEDERDGSIWVENANVVIREYGFIEPLLTITHIGIYNVIISAVDLANNTAMLNYIIIVDNVPPVLTFKAPTASGTGFTMTDTDMTSPWVGITPADIITKSVFNVTDTIDVIIPNSDIVITYSGTTGYTNITEPGVYVINYYVENRAGNYVNYNKYVTYSGYTILHSGDTYTVNSNAVSTPFRYGSITGTTASIILSGDTFVIRAISGATNDEFIWDFGGIGEYNFGSGSTGSTTITVNGTSFTITFNRGTLPYCIYFTITK